MSEQKLPYIDRNASVHIELTRHGQDIPSLSWDGPVLDDPSEVDGAATVMDTLTSAVEWWQGKKLGDALDQLKIGDVVTIEIMK